MWIFPDENPPPSPLLEVPVRDQGGDQQQNPYDLENEMSDKDERVTIKIHLEVNHAANADYGVEIEGPTRAEWDAMTEAEREKYLEEEAETTLENQVSVGAWVEED